MVDRKQAAKAFVDRWAGRGDEKSETQTFWLELLGDVVGMTDVYANVQFEQRTLAGGWRDVVIPDAKTVVEQKSYGINLDKPEPRQGRMVTPYEQAKAYADALPNSQRPDKIIVCNFNEFRLHDLDSVTPEVPYATFWLSELPNQVGLLDFLVDPQKLRQHREEEASIGAGRLVGDLYSLMTQQYIDPTTERARHSLNVLMVRLVFCLFAEDAEVFPENAFFDYLTGVPTRHVRKAILDLFDWLDTKPADRDPYAADELKVFPYVNGGLFAPQDIEVPQFSAEIVTLLREKASGEINWAEISPTIFGGVFESTLNPDVRREGGMHYTSVENIHRVIDPLFLDELTAELEAILADTNTTPRTRRDRLKRYQDKLAGLTFLDPACGSGNFLTETFISLRRLENRVLAELQGPQTAIAFGEATPIKVKLSQFHGIEINDFAVSVAQTAMWIAELQANIATRAVVTVVDDLLPLHDGAHIVEGNALRTDWRDVVDPAKVDYIIGNPPFLGYSLLSDAQKADRLAILGKSGGVLDYAACWFNMASDFMQGTKAHAALVATNSITQGQQVEPLWKPIFDSGISIDFAHRTFVWASESSDMAHVHVVIIGFSHVGRSDKILFTYDRANDVRVQHVDHINAYLVDAPDAFVRRRSKPLSDVPAMVAGGKPTEGGHLLMDAKERAELEAKEPQAAKWIRPFSMGQEFINGIERYCLWLVDCPPQDLKSMPRVLERVKAVREMRLASGKAATQKKAETPWLFDEIKYKGTGNYLAVPAVSSSRRAHVPMGFVTDGMIPGNKLFFVPDAGLYEFGVLTSRIHNAWVRAISGRLKSDFNYSNTVVYNSFIWPDVAPSQRESIADLGQAVLDARALYPGATLADLYDPDNSWLYPKLEKTHANLDAEVERAYGLEPGVDESKIVARLFELYAAATDATKR